MVIPFNRESRDFSLEQGETDEPSAPVYHHSPPRPIQVLRNIGCKVGISVLAFAIRVSVKVVAGTWWL